MFQEMKQKLVHNFRHSESTGLLEMTNNSVSDPFEISLILKSLQQYDYSFFSPDGIDHQLMALYCARALTDGFTPARYTNTRDWEEKLQTFISTVIYRSQLGLGVTIAGLTLSQRFQSASEPNVANTIDDARRVFLIGYMTAAKIMFDNDISLVWWKRTIEREYDCSDLVKLEKKFYKTVAWDVQIDEDEFLRGLDEAFAWYEVFIKEHTLPSSPLPIYHPQQERKARLPASYLSLELADGAQMPVTGVSDAAGLPLPCTAAVLKRRQGLTGMVLRCVTQFS
jgi:hypothetical protein